MGDNVYKVLMGDDAPFLGFSNEKYEEYLRRGKIVNVHYDLSQNNAQNTYTFNTIDVAWIDGQNYVSTNIPLSYSLISNGWGIQLKPEIGDFVIAAFLPGSKPEILRFLKRSEFLQSGRVDVNNNKQILNQYGDPIKIDGEGAYIPFRNIVPGEISIKSKKEAEVFLDDYGTVKLITRKQNKNNCNDRLWEISFGSIIIDETNNEPIKDIEGNNIEFRAINYNSNTEITINSNGKIRIGTNGSQPAVLGDNLVHYLDNIVDTFNLHTHTGNLGFPTLPPSDQINKEDILSEKVEVE